MSIEQLLQSSKHDLIREETEGQTSEEERKNKSVTLVEISRLEVVEKKRDDFKIEESKSLRSDSPITVTQNQSHHIDEAKTISQINPFNQSVDSLMI